MTIFNFLTLLGSLSLFLFGMSVMGTALEKRAGGSLKAILAKLTNGKFSGLLTGLAVTAVIQSSSATTVMVVGFVNSGLLSLKQSIPVIMGANIGTTVTAWLLSLSGISGDSLFVQLLKPSSFTPVLAVIGIILYLTAKGKKKDTGLILLGFATLMFGMESLSGSVSGLRDDPNFTKFFLLFSNPILGVLAGAAAGILVNMIYAYATITLCAEQIVYGMAINIFAPALASFIYRVYFGAGSELVQVSLMETLASRMGITANGFITKLFLDQTPMVYLAYLLVVFTVIYFNRTKSGLNYKAVGEYPKAAATLGIDVIGIKYTASVICGALAGIGGAYLTTCYTTTYVDGNIAGRGFIALAAVIFGRWNAGGVLIACLFFGFCDALQIRLQVGSYNIPYQFFQMIPYIATVVVLAAIGMKKAGPKSCGKPYRKEER